MYELLTLAALALCPPQEVPTPDELWEAGRRGEALERMAADLARRPADRALRERMVRRELSVQRYAAAFEHAAGLGPELDGLRGRALYFLARYDEALPLLSSDQPDTLPLHLEALRALGRTAEVEALIPRAVELFGPDDVRVLLLRARREERAGRPAEAAALFRRASELEPLEPEALFGLGRALVRCGEREEGLALLARHRALTPLLDALDAAERALQLAPLHAPHHAAIGDALRPLIAFDARCLARAGAAYARALQLAAERDEIVAVTQRFARYREEDAHNPAGAIEVLLLGLARVDDARLRVRLADVLARHGRRDEALEHLRAALELRPGDAAVRARIAELEGGRR